MRARVRNGQRAAGRCAPALVSGGFFTAFAEPRRPRNRGCVRERSVAKRLGPSPTAWNRKLPDTGSGRRCCHRSDHTQSVGPTLWTTGSAAEGPVEVRGRKATCAVGTRRQRTLPMLRAAGLWDFAFPRTACGRRGRHAGAWNHADLTRPSFYAQGLIRRGMKIRGG